MQTIRNYVSVHLNVEIIYYRLFTVSHRPQLKRFHDYVLRVEGSQGHGKWTWTKVDHDSDQKIERLN